MEEIRFFTTREDYRHFMLFALFYRPRNVIAYCLLLVAVFLMVFFYQGDPFPLLVVVLVFAFIIFRVWQNISKSAQAAQKRGVNTITISPENLRQRNEQVDSTTSWRVIKAIRQDKHNFYFHVDTPGSSVFMAFLLPRHAFASPEEAESFIERARGYWHEQKEQIATVH
jgi:hypothetical protein